MNVITPLAQILFLFLINQLYVTALYTDAETNTDSYLDTMKIIRKHGYPAEAHVVETADGYLLTMHRIPHGKQPQEGVGGSRRPIFIQHGLLGSSGDYTLIGSDSLPFLLADLGYDVWLGNVRGNTYSRGHVRFFPHDRQFWNFTWHQSAVFDAPAQIDFVSNHTGHPKVIYIGFSMGTTIFFALTSTLPEYNEKIEVALLLAPVAFVKNMKSPLLRALSLISDKAKIIDDIFEHGEFLPSTKLVHFVEKFFCEKNYIRKDLCMNIIFMVVGCDPKEFDKDVLPILINTYPSGYSIKALNHYSQLYKSGKFRQYDYGEEGNMLEYGSPKPPDYDLSLIKAPMYFYEGKNDYLATPQDIKHLAKELTTLKKLRVIKYPKFSHLDFIASLEVKKMVYNLLIKDLTSFLKA